MLLHVAMGSPKSFPTRCCCPFFSDQDLNMQWTMKSETISWTRESIMDLSYRCLLHNIITPNFRSEVKNIGCIIITLHNPGQKINGIQSRVLELLGVFARYAVSLLVCKFCQRLQLFCRVLTLESFSSFVGKRAESKLKVINETRGPDGWNVL